MYKPFKVGKTPNDRFKTPIPLYLDNEHHFHGLCVHVDFLTRFLGIRNMNSLFMRGTKYCFSCETPYDMDKKHTVKCKEKCYDCNIKSTKCPIENGFWKCCKVVMGGGETIITLF